MPVTNQEPAITVLLDRWRAGDLDAEAALIRHIYPMMKQLAQSQIKHQHERLTLSATELAHEAYLRLRDQQHFTWHNRQHFFAIAATVVRRVVVDYLRERFAGKRGGGKLFVDFADFKQESELAVAAEAVDWIAVDQALGKLTAMDPVCARIVELKLFTPLSAEEIAQTCQISEATVGRHWRFARNWLSKELETNQIPDVS
ncbi:RNA polymerase subunit sigma-70 [Ahniella affigens]|uniref:RNA polymerase subunit sigma-70 n=1 Tax=Ahniella affigens TaxID=2021234 RepID=A0A2P1PLY3_9GAMM|nr:ECF-type sigma factor [Ahniella affigens]AVP95860.1 RNA polymerase subunit sigma-70 [Ahniella affigens]